MISRDLDVISRDLDWLIHLLDPLFTRESACAHGVRLGSLHTQRLRVAMELL